MASRQTTWPSTSPIYSRWSCPAAAIVEATVSWRSSERGTKHTMERVMAVPHRVSLMIGRLSRLSSAGELVATRRIQYGHSAILETP